MYWPFTEFLPVFRQMWHSPQEAPANASSHPSHERSAFGGRGVPNREGGPNTHSIGPHLAPVRTGRGSAATADAHGVRSAWSRLTQRAWQCTPGHSCKPLQHAALNSGRAIAGEGSAVTRWACLGANGRRRRRHADGRPLRTGRVDRSSVAHDRQGGKGGVSRQAEYDEDHETAHPESCRGMSAAGCVGQRCNGGHVRGHLTAGHSEP
jgi:hypothetical protein